MFHFLLFFQLSSMFLGGMGVELNTEDYETLTLLLDDIGIPSNSSLRNNCTLPYPPFLCSPSGDLLKINISNYDLSGTLPHFVFTYLQELVISKNNLEGTIPESIGDMLQLTVLSLSFNNLRSIIPESLGNLERLEKLDLSFNHLEGTLPDTLGNLTSLVQLDLTHNYLEGTIPESFGSLTNLEDLVLSTNWIDGEIPSSLGNLTLLTRLVFKDNYLSTTIPESFGQLMNLQVLNLKDNWIEGTIPELVGTLVNLTLLDLSINIMDGTLPMYLGNLSNLDTLDLSDNYFKGTITEFYLTLTSLRELYLGSNYLTGSIPSSLGHMTLLTVLSLAVNNLEGTIPEAIGDMNALQILYLDFNLLSGAIPESIANLTNLLSISASNNLIIGTIPTTLGTLKQLKSFYFNSNSLNGSIPEEISGWTSIEYIALGKNLLSGTLPESIGSLRNLTTLTLEDNRLHGTLPNLFFSIEYLFLDNNQLSGTLPALLSDSPIKQLSLNFNRFSGTLPELLASQINLEILSLNSNLLEGDLILCAPSSSLQSIELSTNNFTSLDWKNLKLCSMLTILDLSFNSIEEIDFNNLPPGLRTLRLNNNRISEFSEVYVNTPLIELNLANNKIPNFQIYDTICLTPSYFQSLQALDLSNNEPGGTIKRTCATRRASSLVTLKCNNNLMDGSIDYLLNILPFINILSLSNNSFDGALPTTLNLYKITELYLDSNNLQGSLPEAMPATLQRLNLQRNPIVGTIPSSWGPLKNLVQINLESTSVCGCVPEHWLTNQWQSCILYNTHLDCACQLPSSCLSSICHPSVKTAKCGINQCSDPGTSFTCQAPRQCRPLSDHQYTYGFYCTDCNASSSVLFNRSFQECSVVHYVIWVPILIVLLIIAGILIYLRLKPLFFTPPLILPNAWFWDLRRITAESYKENKNDNSIYYYKKVTPEAKEALLLDEFIEKLDFRDIAIKKAYAIANITLAQSASNAYSILRNRLSQSPAFYSTSWKQTEPIELRKLYIDHFLKKCSQWDWNKDKTIRDGLVLPVAHGTSMEIGWKIAESGFATLAVIDEGYYGTGMYFSSSAIYTVPYFGTKPGPAILLCLCIPGNTYPVTEEPNLPNSLTGANIKGGYQSHYVVTKRNGFPANETLLNDPSKARKIFDEIVINQEAQVVPMFLIEVSQKGLAKLLTDFARDVPGVTSAPSLLRESKKSKPSSNVTSGEGGQGQGQGQEEGRRLSSFNVPFKDSLKENLLPEEVKRSAKGSRAGEGEKGRPKEVPSNHRPSDPERKEQEQEEEDTNPLVTLSITEQPINDATNGTVSSDSEEINDD